MEGDLVIDVRVNDPQLGLLSNAFDEDGQLRRRSAHMLGWGRGVGKGWIIRQATWMAVSALEHKQRADCPEKLLGVRILGFAPTLKQFKDIHLEGIYRELGKGGRWEHLRGKINRQTGVVRFPGGSYLLPFPANEHTAQTARGMRGDIILADELDDIDPDVYSSVTVPMLSETWSLAVEFLAGSPKRGRHGLWWTYMKAGRAGERLRNGEKLEDVVDDDEMERFRALALSVGEDGESLNEPSIEDVGAALKRVYCSHATYKDAGSIVDKRAVARAVSTTPRETFEREWLANPDAGEGLVYSEFDPRFHIIGAEDCPWQELPKPTMYREFLAGYDPGWGTGAMLLGGVVSKGEYATIIVIDEHYGGGIGNVSWNAWARTWNTSYRPHFFCDPSRGDRIDDLKHAGCFAEGADNSVQGGLARVAEFLHVRTTEAGRRFARIYISPRCKNLIKEFGLYRRIKNKDGSFSDTPDKKNDHACLAAGTKIETERGLVPIEKVVKGDRVLTRSGLRVVECSSLTDKSAELWKLETTAGELVGTADHLVWSEQRGWTRLDALRYDDIVLGWESTAHQRRGVTKGRCSGGIQARVIGTSPTTFGMDRTGICIASSGKRIEVRFPEGTTSITRMGTRATTSCRTSSACPGSSTYRVTASSFQSKQRGVVLLGCERYDRSRQHGTVLQQVAGGIVSTGSRRSRSASQPIVFASNAELVTKRSRLATAGSARTSASPYGGACQEWTTSGADVRFASEVSSLTSLLASGLVRGRVLGVSALRRRGPVYDLQVEGAHEYFAGGVLVHNCDALRYMVVGRFGKQVGGRHEAPGR